MTKTILVEEDRYWQIKDAQTILEKNGMKMKLQDIMSILIPDTDEIVRKVNDKK